MCIASAFGASLKSYSFIIFAFSFGSWNFSIVKLPVNKRNCERQRNGSVYWQNLQCIPCASARKLSSLCKFNFVKTRWKLETSFRMENFSPTTWKVTTLCKFLSLPNSFNKQTHKLILSSENCFHRADIKNSNPKVSLVSNFSNFSGHQSVCLKFVAETFSENC